MENLDFPLNRRFSKKISYSRSLFETSQRERKISRIFLDPGNPRNPGIPGFLGSKISRILDPINPGFPGFWRIPDFLEFLEFLEIPGNPGNPGFWAQNPGNPGFSRNPENRAKKTRNSPHVKCPKNGLFVISERGLLEKGLFSRFLGS